MRTIKDDIYTHDTKRGTTLQTRVIGLYTFDELNDDARDRVIADYMEERENDPYFGQWFIDCYEREIWECVRDLENSISNARVKWQYNRWYSCDFDCEYSYDDCYDPGYITPVDDNGTCYSMDLCDAFNKHVRRLNGLYYQYEHLNYLCWAVYNEWDQHYTYVDHNAHFFARADAMRDRVITLWYEELEKACEDVRNTIEYLLRAEWEYYTSEEYARTECEDESTQGSNYRTIDDAGRVYYSDNRKWYTADGEFYEQSNVNHACVSIVKAG